MTKPGLKPTNPPKPELSRGKGGLIAVLLVAVVVGIQLGGVPWRYRKQLWQLQGAVAGAVVGYLVGRWSRPTG
jgi:hypothetical protein